MTGYINEFNNKNKNKNKITITMSLRVNDEQRFKKYNKIWKNVEKLMRIDFENKPFYGDDDDDDDDNIHIKRKRKIYKKNIITNFHNKKNT